jgi:hypothetical protein
MKDIQWNKIMLREFEALACLSEEEITVLYDWANGKSIAYTTVHHNMCDTKVKDIRKTLREKYDAVQIYTPLLPKRIQ